jgi:hypothetical protein
MSGVMVVISTAEGQTPDVSQALSDVEPERGAFLCFVGHEKRGLVRA